MDHAKRIVVVTGPPGAGKTSVAEALVARIQRSALIDGDAFFRSVRTGRIAPWEPAADDQNDTVVRAIGAAAAEFAAGAFTVVVDAIIGPWFLASFLEKVEGPVVYLILRPSAEVAMRRAMERDPPELVDPEPIAHMFRAFSDLGEHERFVIDSTDMDLHQTIEAALELTTRDEMLLQLPN